VFFFFRFKIVLYSRRLAIYNLTLPTPESEDRHPGGHRRHAVYYTHRFIFIYKFSTSMRNHPFSAGMSEILWVLAYQADNDKRISRSST